MGYEHERPASAPVGSASRAIDPLAVIADDLAALRSQGLWRRLRVLGSAQGPSVTIDGRDLINLSSNDYLGLTQHPRIREAAARAVQDAGAGAGPVRTIAGTLAMHQELESELAAWKGAPSTLTFQSGFTTNTGVIPVIAGDADLIVSDALNHASIIDGSRLSRAHRVVFPHADPVGLREVLASAVAQGRPGGAGPYRLIVVITDGVFSMDGDIAPLPAIVEAAASFGAAVYVDDAHGTGVLGRNGRGTVDHFGLHGRVGIQVGTMSKAVGAMGGYVACDTVVRDLLIARARPFLFSTSQPPAVVAACREAIRVMDQEPELGERLWTNTRRFKVALASLGFDTGRSETPITPVMLGDAATAAAFSDQLLVEGVFAQPVMFPTVAIDGARIRTIMTAAHSDEAIDRAIDAFARVGQRLGVIRP
jgi:glycine C-acetyltransferase